MRVAVADDSMLMREALSRLLVEAGHVVVAAVPDARRLLREVALNLPDVAVVDIRMPPTHTDEGITAAQEIRRRHPGVAVLVLSQYLESGYAMRLVQDEPGRLGYLLKERVVDVSVLVDALDRLLRRPRDPGPLDALTPRETEVLALMAEGRSNASIATSLELSAKTLETHIRQILIKLDLPESGQDHRRVLAVLTYLRSTA